LSGNSTRLLWNSRLCTQSHVNNLTGRHQAAADICREADKLQQKLGPQSTEATGVGVMADAHYGQRRYQEAAETLLADLPFSQENFMRRHQGLCLLRFSYADQAMSDCEQAVISTQESLLIFRELRLTHYEERGPSG
jgi:hypothetical protein